MLAAHASDVKAAKRKFKARQTPQTGRNDNVRSERDFR